MTMPKSVLLGSRERHDLRAMQFTRRGAFLCLLEDDQDRQLYLSLSRSPDMWLLRKNLVLVQPMVNGSPVPYEYEMTPERLTLTTQAGAIECCFSREGVLRVRGRGVQLRFGFAPMLHEGGYPVGHGDWEVSFDAIGKLLFVPLTGAISCNARWLAQEERSCDFVIDALPSAESGVFELAIHEYDACGQRAAAYPPFDECAADAAQDFEAFSRRFLPVPQHDRDAARMAAWVIWAHTLGPRGNLRGEVVYMTRTQWTRAFGWQQSFQAMAACGSAAASWQLLQTMFDYQDAAGQLPDSTGDLWMDHRVSKPGVQGLALDFLLQRHALDAIPRKEIALLYDKLTRYTEWWLSWRDKNGSGLPQYFHADESPGEFCSLFGAGLPMHSADLAAFAALLTEGCGVLAKHLGQTEQAEMWQKRSAAIIRQMLDELWDGKRFIVRNVKTGQACPDESSLRLLPIVLGKRLPKDVIAALVGDLSDEGEYLSENGITIESMRSAGNAAVTPGPRGATTFTSTLVAIGAMNAGHAAVAREIARRSLRRLGESGFALRFGDGDSPSSRDIARWSSWTAACYFILANMLCEEDEG